MSGIANTIELDDLLGEVEKRYPSFTVAGVELRNLMRVSAEVRRAFRELWRAWSEEDESQDRDQADLYRETIRLLAADKGAAEGLIGSLGENLAALDLIVQKYFEATQAGEASPSLN